MTIDEIYIRKEISVRSYNVCKRNEIYSILDLNKYYQENKSFEKLSNCGRRSNEELIDICNKYQKGYTGKKEKSNLKEINSDLTRVQREVINSFIFVNTKSLSVRSRNAISQFLGRNLKVENFIYKIILADNFKVQNIKNVGARSIPEIESYISNIKDFIFEVSQIKDEKHLIAFKNRFLTQRTFDIPLIPNKILETQSIFSLVNFSLNKNAFFDETQTIIIKRSLNL